MPESSLVDAYCPGNKALLGIHRRFCESNRFFYFNRVLKHKNQAVRQGAQRCDKRSIFKAYVSIGERRATLNGGLRRSFSTARDWIKI